MTEKIIKYKVDGRNYDIYESEVSKFLETYPNATIRASVDDRNYEVFPSEMEDFLKVYPNASYTVDNPSSTVMDSNYEPSLPEVEEDAPEMTRMEHSQVSREERQEASHNEDDPSLWETMGKSAGSALVGTAKLALDLGRMAWRNSVIGRYIGQDFDEALQDESNPLTRASIWLGEEQERLSREADPTGGEQGFVDLLGEGKFGKALQKAVGSGIESLPLMLASGTGIGAFLYGAAMAAGNYADETRENPDIPAWKRGINSAGSALLEMAVEKIGGPLNAKKVGKEITEEVAQEILQNVAEEGAETIARRILKGLGKWGKQGFEEGVEEVVTSFGNDALGEALDLIDGDKDYGIRAQWERLKDENPEADMRDFALAKGKEYLDSFLGGALSGLEISGVEQSVSGGLRMIGDIKTLEALEDPYTMGTTLDYADMYDVDDTVRGQVEAVVESFTNESGEPAISSEFIGTLSFEDVFSLSRRNDFTPEQRNAFFGLAKAKAIQEGLTTKLDERLESQVNAERILIEAATENGTIITAMHGGKPVYVMGAWNKGDGTVTAPGGQNGPVMVVYAMTGEKSYVRSEDIQFAESKDPDVYAAEVEDMLRQNDARNRQVAQSTMSVRAKAKAVKPFAGKKILVDVGNGLTEVLVQQISPNGDVIIKGKKGDLGGQSIRTLSADVFYDSIHRDEDGNPVITEAPQEETQAPQEEAPVAETTGNEDYRGQTISILLNGVPTEVEVMSQDNPSDSIVYEYTDASGNRRTASSTIGAFNAAIQQAAEYAAPTETPAVEETPPVETAPTGSETQAPQEVPVTPEDIDWDALFEQDTEAYFVELQNQFGEEAIDILNEEVGAAQEELDSLSKKRGKTQNERLENRQKKVALQGRIDTLNGMVARLAPAAAPAAETPATETPAEIAPAEQPTVTIDPNVPDFSSDRASDARARGYRVTSGQRVDRRGETAGTYGNDIEIAFTADSKGKRSGKVKVIDAGSLVPSHIRGVENVEHFLPEAQPKKRTDTASAVSASLIAQNMNNPQMTTVTTSAYEGAPIVNRRGEVIQGNNRSAALLEMYQSHPNKASEYRQYLIDHASEFGLDANEISAMQNPVLVRELDVEDTDAINLGQYTMQDMESGGNQSIDAGRAIAGLNNNGMMEYFVDTLLAEENEESSDMNISDLITRNGVAALKLLYAQGIINHTQYQSALGSDGRVTADARASLRGIIEQQLFAGGIDNLGVMFEVLPDKAKKAIMQTIARDIKNAEGERLIPYIQQAIEIYYHLNQQNDFVSAKDDADILAAIETYKRQTSFEDPLTPAEKYSNFAFRLAFLFKARTLKEIRAKFNAIYDEMSGAANLFAAGEGKSLAEAVQEVYGIILNTGNYETDGQGGADVLGNNNGESSEGGQGSDGGVGVRTEAGEGGQRTSDGGTDSPVVGGSTGQAAGEVAPVAPNPVDNPAREAQKREKALAQQLQRYGISPEQKSDMAFNAGKAVGDFFATREEYDAYAENATNLGDYNADFERGVEASFANRQQNVGNSPVNSVPLETEPNEENNGEEGTSQGTIREGQAGVPGSEQTYDEGAEEGASSPQEVRGSEVDNSGLIEDRYPARKGDITRQELADAFGLNSVSPAINHEVLNSVYDFMMEMSKMLGISPKSIGHGATLGVKTLKDNSRARAQYSFKQRIDGTIVDANLNFKNSKLSSIAHEWFHSLDQALSYYETGKGKRSATNAVAGEFAGRKETLDAIKGILKAINKSGHKERLKKELWFDKAFMRYSLRKDEMTARAFEEYIRMKFAEAGIDVEGLSENATNHPTSEEMAVIAPAFDNLFKVLQEKEGKTPGTSVLYHIGEIMEEESDARHLATEAVLTALDDNGIDVVRATDEQTQQMLDVAAEVAEMQKGKAPETVSVQDEHHQTVISSADGAKVLKDLDSAIDAYDSDKVTKEKTFLGNVAKALGAKKHGSNSQYATFEAKNGKIFTIRLSNHNARVSNFDNHNEDEGISIVIASAPNSGIDNDGRAHIVEFYYDSIKLRKAEGKPLVEILKSIKQALYSGEYKDNTGLAQVQEVNAPELMTVYHGSPSLFDEFDHSHMGEGEGAQAHGYGTYVAKSADTAKAYARMGRVSYTGHRQSYGSYEYEVVEDIVSIMNHGNSFDEAIQIGRRYWSNLKWEPSHRAKRAFLETLKPEDFKLRNLYDVEIPEDNGENYFYESNPTKKQVEKLYDACQKEGLEYAEVIAGETLLDNRPAGKKITSNLAKMLGSPQAASEFLSRAGFVGIKYDGRRDGECFVIFNERDAKIIGRTEFYQTPNGTVYGWTDGKKIYLTEAGINPNTPIHEYTHLWANAMMQKNPKGWNSIKKLLKGTPVWNEVMSDQNYSSIHNDEDAVASEALSRISGTENAAKMEQMAQKMIDDAKGTARKLEARGLVQNMRDALNRFWEFVWKDLFKMGRFISVEHVTDRILFDLLNGTDLGVMSEGQVQTQIVTDPEVIDKLEASPKRTGYRNVVQNEDGTFSSPMAYWLQGTKEGAKSRVETAKFELGKWEEAEEHPEFVDEKGHVVLVKPNKSTVEVAYDPYIHNRLDPVNLQFKDAWKRDELVYVETVVPETDLESGYHADQALLPVGVHSWSNGDVMLSKYDKPVRIMPWEAVADAWVERLNGNGVHFDVVPPALRSLLVERGVEILPPHKGMGKDCNDAYEAWKTENEITLSRKGKINANFVEQFEFKQNNERQELEYSDEFRRLQEESSRMSGQLVSEKDGVQQAAIRGLGGRIGGTLQRELDRATSGRGNKLRTIVNESKGTSFDIIENVDGRLFHDIFEIVRAYLPNGELVDLHDNYDDAICYITSDGLAGFAVSSDGNLISVYSLYGKSKKGFLGAIKDLITEAGATHLDGYNSRLQPLAEIYSKVFGWKVASMMDYNMEYDHDNIAENHGMPQVAFMVNSEAEIPTRHFTEDQYDEAVEYQLEQVEVSQRVDAQNAAIDNLEGEPRLRAIEHAVSKEAAKLGVNVTYASREDMPRSHKNDKGYYNTKTGEIVICTENASSIADAIQTILHEAVAHKGLRQLMGDRFNEFISRVYESLDAETKAKVDALAAASYNGNTDVAMEEYIASLAETTDFDNNSVWSKIKSIFEDIINAILGRNDIKIGDNELRYILRASYNNMANPRFMESTRGWAQDQMMREEYAINEATPDILSRTGVDPSEVATETARQVYSRTVQARWQEMQRQFQDAMQPVRIAIDAIQQETGNIPIEDYENYLLIKNQASSRSRVEIDNFQRRYFSPVVEQVNKIIDQIMTSRGWKIKDESKRAEVYSEIKQYLIAKHGLERNDLFRSTKGEDRDYSGLTALFGLEAEEYVDAERMAQELVDNFENEVSTDELWAKINAATNKTLRHSYECGLLSRSQYEQIRDMFEFYIPLRGFDETTAEDVYSYLRFESNSFSPAVKEAKGRTSIADDPLAYIMTMAESEITQGNNNRAKQALFNFLLNRASATGKQNTLMQVEDVWYVKSVDGSGVVTQQIAAPNHAAGETYEEFEARMQALEATGDAFKSKKGQVDVGMRFQVKRNQNAHYIYLKVNGVEKAIYINGDPKAADAVNGRYAEKPGALEEKMREINRLISSTFTNYSLEFTFSNYFRDMVYANINIGVKESDPAYRRRFRRNWAHNNMRSMIRMLKAYRAGDYEGRTDLNEDEAAFVEFMENGGQTGYTLINSVETRKKDLERAIERMQNGIDKGGVRDSTVFRYTLGGIELLNEASELVTRFAAFKTSRDMGRSVLESVNDAKEITVNFNTKGAQDGKGWMGAAARWFGATKFFFNATVQGVQNVKAMADANKLKFGTVVGSLVATGFLMPVLQGMLTGLLGGDDDENWYWDIPEYDRQSALCVVTGKGKYVKVPLPVGLNKMYALGDVFASWLFDKKHTHNVMDIGKEMANLVAGTVLPVNPLEGTVNELSLIHSTINAVAPSSTQAVIQYLSNTDWKGAPIQKEYTYNRNDPQWMKAYNSNPAVLKALSKWCYENVKWDGWFRGWDWSPEHLDNTLSNFGGGIYSLIKKTGQAMSMIWNEEDRDISKIPVVGVLFRTVDDRFGYVNEAYYDLKEEFDSEVDPIKKTAKAFGYSLDEVFKPVAEGGKRAGDNHPKMQKDVYGNRHFEHMQAWYLGQKKLDSINNKIKKQEKKMAKIENPPQGEFDKMAKLQAEYETTRTELVNGMLESKYEQIIDKFRK